MARIFEQLFARRNFDQQPQVHDGHAMGEMPYDLEIVQAWLRLPPSESMDLLVRDLPSGRIVWFGEISSINRMDSEAEITCISDLQAAQRNGLNLCWQIGCPYALYGFGCDLPRDPFRVNATVITVAGNTVQASEFAAFDDTYFPGGDIEWESEPGISERRFVESQTGSVLTLFGQALDLPVGTVVAAFPGCDHTLGMCDSRFHNALNYGGVPNKPVQSPFNGSPVY